jgi:hypothetical protein
MSDLKDEEKEAIQREFLILCDRQKLCLPHGGLKRLVEMFNRSEATIDRVIKNFKDQHNEGILMIDNSNKKKGHCGTKSKLNEEIATTIKQISDFYQGMKSYRDLQCLLEDVGIILGLSTIQRYCIKLGVKRESVHIKPKLSPEQKMKRLEFCLNQIDISNKRQLVFKPQTNRVHWDEKWFNQQPTVFKRKVFPDSDEFPAPSLPSKSNMPKIMFGLAVTEPIQDHSGLLALQPFAQDVPAERRSFNREAGTIEVKPMTVTAEVIYETFMDVGGIVDIIVEVSLMLIHVIVIYLTILQLLIPYNEQEIEIQWDGAKPHIGLHNIDRINEELHGRGLNIHIIEQPPYSPDLNVCDGSLFRSLQAQSYRIRGPNRTYQNIVDDVTEVFQSYDDNVLARCFGHLYAVYNEVIRTNGDNQFKEPHYEVRNKQKIGVPLNEVNLPWSEIKKKFKLVADWRND